MCALIWEKSNAKTYEEHVEKVLKRRFPKTQWQLETQSPVKYKGTTLKIDFKLTNRQKGNIVIVDAKSGKVTISDLRQLDEYKSAVRASKTIIYTATPLGNLAKPIKDRARESSIEINYTAPRDIY